MTRFVNLGQFIGDLNNMNQVIEDAVGLITRKVSLDVLSRVVLATPVLTGRARGNWQVDVGGVPSGELTVTDPGGGATISAGSAKIGEVKQKPFQEVNLVNNLPYISALNGGSSNQSPAGFVENAVDAAVRFT